MQLIEQMTNKPAKVRIEELTKSEHRKLKNLLLGYGNFRKQYIKILVACNYDKNHKNYIARMTLHNVSTSGYGHPDTIKTIREIILTDANLQNENENSN